MGCLNGGTNEHFRKLQLKVVKLSLNVSIIHVRYQQRTGHLHAYSLIVLAFVFATTFLLLASSFELLGLSNFLVFLIKEKKRKLKRTYCLFCLGRMTASGEEASSFCSPCDV